MNPEEQINKAFIALSKQNQETIKRLLMAESRIDALLKENYEMNLRIEEVELFQKAIKNIRG